MARPITNLDAGGLVRDGAIVSGSLLSVLVFAIHPAVPSSGLALLETIHAHAGAWMVAHSLAFFDGLLFLVGGWVLCDRLAAWRPRPAKVARVMLVVGSVAISAISTGELVLGKVGQAVGNAPPVALAMRFNHGGTGVFVGGLVLLHIIGLMTATVALWRARVVPVVAVAAMFVGCVLFWDPSDGINPHVVLAGDFIRMLTLVAIVVCLRRAEAPLVIARTPAVQP